MIRDTVAGWSSDKSYGPEAYAYSAAYAECLFQTDDTTDRRGMRRAHVRTEAATKALAGEATVELAEGDGEIGGGASEPIDETVGSAVNEVNDEVATTSGGGETSEQIGEVADGTANQMGDAMAEVGGGGEASEPNGEMASGGEAAEGERPRRRTTKRRGRAGRSGFSRSIDAARQQDDEAREAEGAARV